MPKKHLQALHRRCTEPFAQKESQPKLSTGLLQSLVLVSFKKRRARDSNPQPASRHLISNRQNAACGLRLPCA